MKTSTVALMELMEDGDSQLSAFSYQLSFCVSERDCRENRDARSHARFSSFVTPTVYIFAAMP
jgi:hypothetical protein